MIEGGVETGEGDGDIGSEEEYDDDDDGVVQKVDDDPLVKNKNNTPIPTNIIKIKFNLLIFYFYKN